MARRVRMDLTSGVRCARSARRTSFRSAMFRPRLWVMKISTATAHGATFQPTDAFGFQSSQRDGLRIASVTGCGSLPGAGPGLTTHHGDSLRSIMGDGFTSPEYGPGLLVRP